MPVADLFAALVLLPWVIRYIRAFAVTFPGARFERTRTSDGATQTSDEATRTSDGATRTSDGATRTSL